mgnify:CR=1 FL=1
MKRILTIVLAVGLILSACASNGGSTVEESNGDAEPVVDEQTGDAGGETSGSETDESSLPENEDDNGTDDPATSGLAEPGDSPPPADDSDSLVLGDGVPPEVTFAMKDLAARLGISEDLIDWVSHVEVDWPDASAGCPFPDMAYAQVVTNGTLTIFEVDGVEYRYHSRAGMDPFYCDPASADKTAAGSVDQLDLSDFVVPSPPGSDDTGSTPTESIPPGGGSDE